MTEQSFEYRALRFLNDRIELYNIDDQSLKIALYDFPENQYSEGIDSLRKENYLKNKDHYDKGLSITNQGQLRLQQLQSIIDKEKQESTISSGNGSPIDEQPSGIRKYFLINGNTYTIGTGIFWVALPIICSLSFFLGTVKYDADKINLSDQKKALEDTVKIRENKITELRHYSDSALNILSHMPYSEMTLDTLSFRKVQTTIENASAVLSSMIKTQ
jgi:hypothetical protein